MRKELRNNYLFLSINYQDRLVKISAVSNIVSFRNMMRIRHPEFEIINDTSPLRLKLNENLVYKLMSLLEDCRHTEGNKYRTYKLDSYKVQTVIKLVTRSHKKIRGYDNLICKRCGNSFEADYNNLQDIYQFINLNISYCSSNCEPKIMVLRERYCRCGELFIPDNVTDFYCRKCQ